jgi:helix-turn-helix protein
LSTKIKEKKENKKEKEKKEEIHAQIFIYTNTQRIPSHSFAGKADNHKMNVVTDNHTTTRNECRYNNTQ